jgi:uncharacterized membrane protein YidH (DUF202 family)
MNDVDDTLAEGIPGLATERTAQAWHRTGIAALGASLAIGIVVAAVATGAFVLALVPSN